MNEFEALETAKRANEDIFQQFQLGALDYMVESGIEYSFEIFEDISHTVEETMKSIEGEIDKLTESYGGKILAAIDQGTATMLKLMFQAEIRKLGKVTTTQHFEKKEQ